jgi:protein-S-isoprenylcysteine O-methyltransferase Ste14
VFAGLLVAALGQLWRIYAAGMIRKNKQLATNGAYSLVRHPLYLGNFVIILGFTLACGNWIVALLVIFFLFFYYPAAIRYEDFKLEGIFGDEWRAWSQGTPAMLPNSLKWRSSPETTWSFRQSMIRNGEAVYSLYMVASGVLLWYRA